MKENKRNIENKVNVAEILKLCPTGMKLNCTMYDNVFFDKIDENIVFAIRCYTINNGIKSDINFTSFGTCSTDDGAKCVIFPDGKTTWKDFVSPCNFKDGDIVSSRYGNPFILKATFPKSDSVSSYCALDFDDNFQEGCNKWTQATGCRYATEEEKQKLFDVIKANGYKWNAETKILEKLEDVDDKGNISDGYHTFNELYEYRLLYNASMFNELAKQGLYDVHKSKKHSDGTIPFGDENWFIVQAELPTGQISNHYEMKEWDLFNIPEKEKANPYDGHTPQDVAKRLRDFLSLEKLVKSKFKDGDIIFTHANCLKVGVGNTWISIFKEIRNGGVATYVDCCEDEVDYYDDLDGDKPLLCMESDILRQRLATEEEKVKLFNKIQEHGYRWNVETKTLEKLVEPKFKVGDIISNGICTCIFNGKETDIFYGFYVGLYNAYFIKNTVMLKENTHLATEEEKQKLFDVIRENGYKWNSETKTLEKLIVPKFKVGDRIKYRHGEIIYRIVKIMVSNI